MKTRYFAGLIFLLLITISFAFAKGGDFRIMESAIKINITSPLDSQWYTYIVDSFNWKLIENTTSLISCRYTLNGNPTDFDCSLRSLVISGTEGTNTLSIRIESIDAMATDSIIFNIDTISPDITINSPTATEYPNKVNTIVYTLIETNPNSCWYSVDGINNVPFNCAAASITVPESPENWST